MIAPNKFISAMGANIVHGADNSVFASDYQNSRFYGGDAFDEVIAVIGNFFHPSNIDP